MHPTGNVLSGGWCKEYPHCPLCSQRSLSTSSTGLHKSLQGQGWGCVWRGRHSPGLTWWGCVCPVVSVGRANNPATFLGKTKWQKLRQDLLGECSSQQLATDVSNSVGLMLTAGLCSPHMAGDTRFSGVGQETRGLLSTPRHGTIRTEASRMRTLKWHLSQPFEDLFAFWITF